VIVFLASLPKRVVGEIVIYAKRAERAQLPSASDLTSVRHDIRTFVESGAREVGMVRVVCRMMAGK
jgi:hypothetical protein